MLSSTNCHTDGHDIHLTVVSQCTQVGWPKRKLSKLETALKGSYLVSAVLKRELSADEGIVSEQLIALIRCTSDRVFNATIWDVLVSPEYQVKPYLCLAPYRHTTLSYLKTLQAYRDHLCLHQKTLYVQAQRMRIRSIPAAHLYLSMRRHCKQNSWDLLSLLT